MALFQESGGTNADRVEEATKLCERLSVHFDEMTKKEQEFLSSVDDMTTISPKLIFWLRDLCTKYDA